MIATNLKQILAERETGTAVQSANTLKWQESLAFNSDVYIETDPIELYRFNTQLYMQPDFLDTFMQSPTTFLHDLHLVEETVPELPLSAILDRQLSKEEREALLQIIAVAKSNFSNQEVLEETLATGGYGVLAVAALVLVVVVAVGLFVVVA